MVLSVAGVVPVGRAPTALIAALDSLLLYDRYHKKKYGST
jgi:hypothetical protein